MSGTKKCPYCGEEIKAEAKKCRYCGEWLEEKPTESQTVVKEIPANEPQKQTDEEIMEELYAMVEDKKERESVLYRYISSYFGIFCYAVLTLEFLSLAKYAAIAFNMSVADGHLFSGVEHGVIMNAITACRLIPDWITDLSTLFLAAVAYCFYQELKNEYGVSDHARHRETVLWAMLFTCALCGECICAISGDLFGIDWLALLGLACWVFVGVALIMLGFKYKNEFEKSEILKYGGAYVGLIFVSLFVLLVVIVWYGEGSMGYNVFMCIGSLAELVVLYYLVAFIYKEVTNSEIDFSKVTQSIIGISFIISFVLCLLPENVQKKLEAKAVAMEIENEAEETNGDADDSNAEVYQLEAVEDARLMHGGGPELAEIGSFGGYDYFVLSEYSDGSDERGCPANLLLYRLTGYDPSSAAGIDISKINELRGSDDETGYKFRADIIMDYILRDGDLFLVLQDSREMEEKEPSMALVKLNLDTYKATIVKLKEVIEFGDDRETVKYADSYGENAQAEEVNLSDL